MNITIKDADPLLYPQIVAMGEKFHYLAGIDKIAPFNEAGVFRWCERLSTSGLLLAAVDEFNKVLGVIGIVIGPFLNNDEYNVASEMIWWVDPEVRGQNIGVRLIAEAEAILRTDPSIKFFSMMCLEAVNPDAVASIYERNGFRCYERAFIKELR